MRFQYNCHKDVYIDSVLYNSPRKKIYCHHLWFITDMNVVKIECHGRCIYLSINDTSAGVSSLYDLIETGGKVHLEYIYKLIYTEHTDGVIYAFLRNIYTCSVDYCFILTYPGTFTQRDMRNIVGCGYKTLGNTLKTIEDRYVELSIQYLDNSYRNRCNYFRDKYGIELNDAINKNNGILDNFYNSDEFIFECMSNSTISANDKLYSLVTE